MLCNAKRKPIALFLTMLLAFVTVFSNAVPVQIMADVTTQDESGRDTVTEKEDVNGLSQMQAVSGGAISGSAISITIKEARSLETGTENVCITGIVHFIDGKNVYVEDETAGIDLYLNQADQTLHIGDKLTVMGTLSAYKGLEQLTDVSYEVLEENQPLYETEVTISDILKDPNAYECRRVHITEAVIGDINPSGNTVLTQNDAVINIYRMPETDVVAKGDTVSLYASVGYFNNPQLRISAVEDITKVAGGVMPTPAIVYDPITEEMVTENNAQTIDAAYTIENGSKMTVIGQVAFHYGNVYNNANSLTTVILQDVIDDEIIGLQVYDRVNTYTTGDIVVVTGTVSEYGSVRQLGSVESVQVVKADTPFEAQKLTIAELLSGGDSYLSEYVCIEDAVIGAYSASGNTPITDSTGTINLYKGALLPEEVSEGDTITLYAAFSKYNTTYQLRNGVSSDYVKQLAGDDVIVDTSVVLPVASWAGTGTYTEPTVYADLDAYNDQLDKTAYITHSSGKVPQISTTSANHLGFKGNQEGDYYLITLDSLLYGNITLNYSMKSSATGPKNFQVAYSVDGEQWTDVALHSISQKSTFENFSVTLPEGANNAEMLYIRLMVAGNVAVNGNEIGKSGTNYLSPVTITGSPVISKTIAGYPELTPNAGAVRIGQEISMKSSTEGASIYYSINDGEYKLYNSDEKPVLEALPAVVTAYAVKEGLQDSLKVTYAYTWEQTAPVNANPNGGAKTVGTKVSLSCDTKDAIIYYSLNDGVDWKVYHDAEKIVLSELPCSITAKAVADGCKESETSVFSFTKRLNEEYNIYFGQLHSHTSYSDGTGTCEEAFDYAKNTAKQIDFLAVTDHSNSFDNASSASLADGSMSTEWMEGHELADRFTDDSFVAIYGFEMTWSNGLGHMNTFNTDGFQSRTQTDYSTYSTALANYYTTLKTDTSSLSQFNHPGTTFGDFTDFAHYDAEIDNLITLLEVGNGEGAIGSSGYFPSYEYYTRALDKGWHVAPSNNQDNHKGAWGDSNTARTVILADTLTRDNIYDAMRNMRVYATEDNDLEITYTLNDEIMGTILSSTPEEVSIDLKLKDPTDSAIGKVEVIVNGGLSIASKTVSSNEAELTFELPADYSYYYIRITQPDNDIAVTAPVWTGEVEAAGISSVSTSSALAVKGEPFDITTVLYNNEKEALDIQSMSFAIGDEVIHTVDLASNDLTTVPSFTEKSYTFYHTHSEAGSVDIQVTVKALLNGVEKIYKGVLNENFADPSMVTKVVVDGTHYNDYVTGYYGGNMGNFASIAAEDQVKVQIVTDQITDETLKDCSLLIISAPAKKSGTANAGNYTVSHFEDQFIETVKEYIKRGGDVILCGIADYQDTESGQTSVEMNRLLKAIGATTRINSDEAVDDELNGGQNYRLYLTDFNMDSEYTKGIQDGSQYSAYSGCTVLLDEDAVKNGQAEYLVKGHKSTYSINSKTYADENYHEVEKGNAYMLAHESLESGSNLFISSTVFMSDFEVKAEMDNIWDVPYANRTIILNILESCKTSLANTPIAKIRDGEIGNIYQAEGIVTAGTKEGNAFFDTIYIQDETGGINIFPINEGEILPGQKVKVTGYLDQYLGDLELRVISAEVTDTSVTAIAPLEVTTKQAMDYMEYGGMLVKVKGVVTDVILKNGIVETILVKDESGVEARVFIDGYILASDSSSAKLEGFVTKGNTISAIGLVSYDTEGERIRVRDRSEIVFVSAGSDTPVTPTITPAAPTEVPVTPTTVPVKPTETPVTPTITPTVTPTVPSKPSYEEDDSDSTQTKTDSAIRETDTERIVSITVTKTDATGNKTVTTTEYVYDLTTGAYKGMKTTSSVTDSIAAVTTVIEKNARNAVITADAQVIWKDSSALIKNGIAKWQGTVPQSALLTAAEGLSSQTPLLVTVTIPNAVAKQLNTGNVTKLELNLVIPKDIAKNTSIQISDIVVSDTILLKAKQKGKEVVVQVKTENQAVQTDTLTLLYGISFDGAMLKVKDAKIQTVNAALVTNKIINCAFVSKTLTGILSKDTAKNSLLLTFRQEGAFPQAVKLIVNGAYYGLKADSTLFGYAYEKENETKPFLSCSTEKTVMDKNGFLTLTVNAGGQYVLLAEQQTDAVVSSLWDQVAVAVKDTMKKKEVADIAVTLPKGADETSVSYFSSKKSILTVNKNGKVYAKQKGSATITVTVMIDEVQHNYDVQVTVY
ncbi:MAG: hypothetical protein E7256_00620 [Lachnospiraceae bacterium]|nr:hypothetical protein [Lachnospiraceae bacterium]